MIVKLSLSVIFILLSLNSYLLLQGNSNPVPFVDKNQKKNQGLLKIQHTTPKKLLLSDTENNVDPDDLNGTLQVILTTIADLQQSQNNIEKVLTQLSHQAEHPVTPKIRYEKSQQGFNQDPEIKTHGYDDIIELISSVKENKLLDGKTIQVIKLASPYLTEEQKVTVRNNIITAVKNGEIDGNIAVKMLQF